MSEEKRYKGIRYEIPCSITSTDVLVIRAFENGAGNVVLGVEVGNHDVDGYDAYGSVVIGPEHLTELHGAFNGALGAVATNGIRLVEEQAEAEFRELMRRGVREAT